MDIKGKVNLFVNEFAKKEGEKPLKTFSTTIFTVKEDKKSGDETTIRKSMRVYFAKDLAEKSEKLDPEFYYELEITEGWLKAEQWTNKSGETQTEICAFVKAGKLVKKIPLKKKKVKEDSPADSDLPF